MTRVAILHGYSSENLGDGLLVDSAIEVIKAACGSDTAITLFALRPDSFADRGCEVISAKPSSLKQLRDYVRGLLDLRSFDLVIGVGGGYLRFGSVSEAVRTFVVHGPQLAAASLVGARAAYLPQSIGPVPGRAARVLRGALSRMQKVYVRDDRSAALLSGLPNVERVADMAIWTNIHGQPRTDSSSIDSAPVVSTRYLDGELPKPVVEFVSLLAEYDGYVQSRVGGNNDVKAVDDIQPSQILTKDKLFAADARPRVVVAMRLHAALMAIRSGHYVIHLAYERKGFGAFADLGVMDYVHSARSFDPVSVHRQVNQLTSDYNVRHNYNETIRSAYLKAEKQGRSVIETLSAISSAGVAN